jgi:hypothetical protein
MAITYPVQSNTRWSVYDTFSSSIVVRNRPWPVGDGGPIQGLNPGLVMLLQVSDTQPTYDSRTQKVEKTETIDTDANTITKGWNVVALTQQEIDDRTPSHYTTAGGIKLAIEEQDQNAFARMNTLIDLAGMAGTDNITLKDVFGDTHSMTVSDFKTEMVAYGNHCYTLFLA